MGNKLHDGINNFRKESANYSRLSNDVADA